MNIRAIIGFNMSLDDGGGVENSSVVLTVNTNLPCAGVCWHVPGMHSMPGVPKRIQQ